MADSAQTNNSWHRPGFIYIASRTRDDAIKIGYSDQPSRRAWQMSNQWNTGTITILQTWRVACMPCAERRCHAALAAHRVPCRGLDRCGKEWFAVSREMASQAVTFAVDSAICRPTIPFYRTPNGMVRLNVLLPPDLHLRFKLGCIEEDKTMTAVMTAFLEERFPESLLSRLTP